MHKNWFEQFEPVLKNWLEKFEPAWMSPWTAHAQPVRTGLSSVNQFKPVPPASLNQFDSVSAWKSMTIYTMLLMHKNW